VIEPENKPHNNDHKPVERGLMAKTVSKLQQYLIDLGYHDTSLREHVLLYLE
jgi:hypothetical protein